MRTNNLIARLEKRKRDMIITLEHIRQQQMEVDRNAESMDGWARQRRRALLADLSGWYDAKLKQIDGVIDRITQPDRFAWSKHDSGTAPSQARVKNRSLESKIRGSK